MPNTRINLTQLIVPLANVPINIIKVKICCNYVNSLVWKQFCTIESHYIYSSKLIRISKGQRGNICIDDTMLFK